MNHFQAATIENSKIGQYTRDAETVTIHTGKIGRGTAVHALKASSHDGKAFRSLCGRDNPTVGRRSSGTARCVEAEAVTCKDCLANMDYYGVQLFADVVDDVDAYVDALVEEQEREELDRVEAEREAKAKAWDAKADQLFYEISNLAYELDPRVDSEAYKLLRDAAELVFRAQYKTVRAQEAGLKAVLDVWS